MERSLPEEPGQLGDPPEATAEGLPGKVPVWGWALLASALMLIVTVSAIETRAPAPAAEASATPTAQSTDEKYVLWVRDNTEVMTLLSDETIINTARISCDARADGMSMDSLRESIRKAYPKNLDYYQAYDIVKHGISTYCPQHYVKYDWSAG